MSEVTQTKVFNTLLKQVSETVQDKVKMPYGFYQKIETRARNNDYTEAMSFETYDPLWLLGRQWQFGRFQGNDCGSTVSTKIEVERQPVEHIFANDGIRRDYTTDKPLEFDVEKRPHAIDPYVRIESALHFLGMKSLPADKKTVMEMLREKCPLDPFLPAEEKTVEQVKAAANTKMDKFYRFYGKKCFDGYKLYRLDSLPEAYATVHQEYKNWFKKKYLADREAVEYWNEKKLGYELKIGAQAVRYTAEDYHTGRLSWYSFDKELAWLLSKNPAKPVTLGALPAPATFPAAPNRRLWEFENRRVQFNDWQNNEVTALASSVILQYTMMYSNDWMIVPLETEVGTVLTVKDIIIKDSFGREFHINKSFEDIDDKKVGVGFTDRWAMYSNVYANAYAKNSFRSAPGLLFPPTLQRVEQGAPIEEVQFLRDEMANMVWGVENVVSDGCGGSLDSRSRSDKVFSIIDERRKVDDRDIVKDPNADFSYLIENRVPLHWIPFIPQNIKGEVRDIIFRRARMPIWYDGKYQPVEPSSQLLAVKRANKKTIPRYVYEEEILGYGTKVGLYPQRTRWFNGASFTWQGYEKKISGVQANSGLMFDALLDVEKKEEEGSAE